ncbi:MAG: hypothetical protein CL557_17700 [Alphaproteobacteria bacterium]|nr:hypothetical protein [Alphaproteobacteria bacterium]
MVMVQSIKVLLKVVEKKWMIKFQTTLNYMTISNQEKLFFLEMSLIVQTGKGIIALLLSNGA